MSMLFDPAIIDSYYSGYLQASWGEVGIIYNTAQDYVTHIDYFIDRVEKSLPLSYEMVGDLSYKKEGDKNMTKIPLNNYPPKTKAELFILMRGDEVHKWQELKFTRIDDLKIFAQKTKSGMLVMLWKPFATDTIRKCDVNIVDSEGLEVKPVISKKNVLILRLEDGELYSFDFKCEGQNKSYNAAFSAY